MVRKLIILLICLVLLLVFQVRLTRIRDARPPEIRLAYYPPAPVLKALSGDHYQLVSHLITLQCMFYFGSLVEEKEVRTPPAWDRLAHALVTATRLDPYNVDAYYFAQAVLTWDAGMVAQAVELLEYGSRYRTWDWYIPFFLSFDYAFFLKQYEKAADYLRRAAELNPRAAWFSTLAARYYYEGGRTALAIAYLKELIPTIRNQSIRRNLEVRAMALERILLLENAVAAYSERFDRRPENLQELIRAGILQRIPRDPYGGTFYLDERGRVRTTSRLTFRKEGRGNHQD